MIELVQLERHHADFARRNVKIVVVSLEGEDDAAKTAAQFPHLTVVADTDRRLISAAGTLHEHADPNGNDAAAPTTVVVDRDGVVRYLFRPDRFLQRLLPDQLLAEIDRVLP